MSTVVMRLWLPDLPGTLGRVAAAIGRANGDVIGIEILERGAGMAIDELTVMLPDGATSDALIDEVSDVEGVAVEDVHEVAADRPDQSVLALDVAARIMEAPATSRAAIACELVREMLESDWCVIFSDQESVPLATSGDVPDLAWLAAFIDGASHLSIDDAHEYTPSDMAWAPLAQAGPTIVSGRSKGAFRLRERRHLTLIARIIGSVPMVDSGPQ
ncbi:MAG: hypothetical protein EB010_11275 [Acidimicrobiia bacterium]|nr:hypothetical protein [Acidimicrobiia bacterium]